VCTDRCGRRSSRAASGGNGAAPRRRVETVTMTDPASPVPAPPDPAEHDLELTVSALKEGPAALGIPGALVEIRRWQERIDGTDAPALEEIGAALAELRGELESDAPDDGVVSDLMHRLSTMTLTAAADQPEGNLRSRLQELGHLLGTGAAEVD
jgi:hypothetical protein